jgi:pyrimidine operon attenuation protein / uracil phosphoribosyltransferase
MVADKTLILNERQVQQKIKRMAYEIFEHNFKEKGIVIAGIDGQGYILAKLLIEKVKNISPLEIKLVKVSLDKLSPLQGEVTLDCDLKELKKKCIILVDDVLNTGRTFAYGMKHFLTFELKKIHTAVLVNRSHTLFPIYPQYTGYELATTIKDHVEVRLGNETSVYLV